MMGHTAAMLFALTTLAAAPQSEVSHWTQSQMAAGQGFQIETADHVYRGKLLDRNTGACQMTVSEDGADFAPARTVYLLGATAGRQGRQMLVLMHEVKVGMRMELSMDDLRQKNRLITSEVKAIKLTR